MSTRQKLIEQLKRYGAWDGHEARMRERILGFVEAHAECFERTLQAGHVTGSAWVVDHDRHHALLVHHVKLGKWLQPGGHCDGDADILGVALRETQEESGLTCLRPLSSAIYDVDAHDIPALKNEPAHVHYDIRFLLEADRGERPQVSAESHDVRWVRLAEISGLNTDESVIRLVAKLPEFLARITSPGAGD
jgi:8-oxo-dGTP pyrophosphatase MutT (NUDIX family)